MRASLPRLARAWGIIAGGEGFVTRAAGIAVFEDHHNPRFWRFSCHAACKPKVYGLNCGVIKRFNHKGLEALFRTGCTKGVNPQLADKLRRMLARLNDGPLPEAMSLPGYRLHALQGDRKGAWSVWVSGNYRITFEIEDGDATKVDFEDYH